MSEPTPLSAEVARAMTLLVMASRVDSNLRSAVADVETYVAELQREIEGYRQALSERWVCRAHRAGEQGEHQVGNSDCDYARRILGQI